MELARKRATRDYTWETTMIRLYSILIPQYTIT